MVTGVGRTVGGGLVGYLVTTEKEVRGGGRGIVRRVSGRIVEGVSIMYILFVLAVTIASDPIPLLSSVSRVCLSLSCISPKVCHSPFPPSNLSLT